MLCMARSFNSWSRSLKTDLLTGSHWTPLMCSCSSHICCCSSHICFCCSVICSFCSVTCFICSAMWSLSHLALRRKSSTRFESDLMESDRIFATHFHSSHEEHWWTTTGVSMSRANDVCVNLELIASCAKSLWIYVYIYIYMHIYIYIYILQTCILYISFKHAYTPYVHEWTIFIYVLNTRISLHPTYINA